MPRDTSARRLTSRSPHVIWVGSAGLTISRTSSTTWPHSGASCVPSWAHKATTLATWPWMSACQQPAQVCAWPSCTRELGTKAAAHLAQVGLLGRAQAREQEPHGLRVRPVQPGCLEADKPFKTQACSLALAAAVLLEHAGAEGRCHGAPTAPGQQACVSTAGQPAAKAAATLGGGGPCCRLARELRAGSSQARSAQRARCQPRQVEGGPLLSAMVCRMRLKVLQQAHG